MSTKQPAGIAAASCLLVVLVAGVVLALQTLAVWVLAPHTGLWDPSLLEAGALVLVAHALTLASVTAGASARRE